MISTRTALDITSSVFGVSHTDILSPSRKKKLIEARACAGALLHEFAGESYVNIAHILKRSGHASAVHWVNRIKQSKQHEKALYEKWLECIKVCENIEECKPADFTDKVLLERICTLDDTITRALNTLIAAKEELVLIREAST